MIRLDLISDDVKHALEYLNQWSNTAMILEKKYYSNRDIVSNKDIKFLGLLGQCIYFINSANSDVICGISKAYPPSLDREKLISFLKFVNGLISSKAKYFFFRENTIPNTNSPFLDIDFEIFSSSQEALKILSSGPINKLGGMLCRYLFFADLLYSFVYDKESGKGVFYRYEYNEKLYKELKAGVLDKLPIIENEEDLRYFGSNFIAEIARIYIKFYSKESEGEVFYKNKSEIYSALFRLSSQNKDVYMEPMISHLSHILWKTDGMIQYDDEFICDTEKRENDARIIDLICGFVRSYINFTDSVYISGEIDFYELYHIVSNFIAEISEMLLVEKEHGDVLSSIDEINKIVNNSDTSNDIISFIIPKNNEFDIFTIINKLRRIGDDAFKVYSIIEHLDKDEILFLLGLYSDIFPRNELKDKKTEFVGIYTAGVFLAHIINLFTGLNKPVWLFKTKPYVATHPIHKETNEDFHSIYIFDETYKTGFTYSLYEAYLSRNFHGKNLSTNLGVIFKFDEYSGSDIGNVLNVKSLFDLNSAKIPINKSDVEFILKSYKKELFLAPKEINIEELIGSLVYETPQVIDRQAGGNGRLDFTFLLTNTDVVLAMCTRFKNIIEQSIVKNGKKDVFLFSASPEGEVLSLFTGFLLRLSNVNVTFKSPDTELLQKTTKVAIDLTHNTGFSLASRWGIFSEGRFDKAQIDRLNSDFDLILAICGRDFKAKNTRYLHILNNSGDV